MEYFTGRRIVKFLSLFEAIPLSQVCILSNKIIRDSYPKLQIGDFYLILRLFRKWKRRYRRNPRSRKTSWIRRKVHPDNRIIF